MDYSTTDPQRRALLAHLLALGGTTAGLSLLSRNAFAAGNNQLVDMRFSHDADGTRVVFDLSHSAKHHIFVLHHPERLVVDFRNTRAGGSFNQSAPSKNGIIRDVRHARRNHDDLRVVFDLSNKARPSSFLIPPNADSSYYRLVLDLQQDALAPTKSIDKGQLRDLVVAIDPGHGGKDPGAIGLGGTYEKNVVLPISRKLRDALNKQRGIHAELTRDSDVYLHLRERTQIAHEMGADLFLSIHADAFRDRSVTGSSVYVLSEHGASSEMARQLARSQNGVDPWVGNINLSGTSKELASVLLDLSQTATMSANDRLARQVLNQLKVKHSNRIERAAFVVLKSPDIPSALIETAFISNPHQEKLLCTDSFQHRIAGNIQDGVMSYFQKYAPTDTLVASLSGRTATS